jgi:hypothetical protein
MIKNNIRRASLVLNLDSRLGDEPPIRERPEQHLNKEPNLPSIIIGQKPPIQTRNSSSS